MADPSGESRAEALLCRRAALREPIWPAATGERLGIAAFDRPPDRSLALRSRGARLLARLLRETSRAAS